MVLDSHQIYFPFLGNRILERLRSNSLDDKNNEFINQLDFIRLINEITSSYDNNNINIIISNDPYFENINVTIPRSAEIVHSITNVVDLSLIHI